jgi:hypothetical protein
MTHSPASASGDQPPAGPGLTAHDPTAGDLTRSYTVRPEPYPV